PSPLGPTARPRGALRPSAVPRGTGPTRHLWVLSPARLSRRALQASRPSLPCSAGGAEPADERALALALPREHRAFLPGGRCGPEPGQGGLTCGALPLGGDRVGDGGVGGAAPQVLRAVLGGTQHEVAVLEHLVALQGSRWVLGPLPVER